MRWIKNGFLVQKATLLAYLAIPDERNLVYLMYSTYTSFKVLHFSKAVLADITFKLWEHESRV